VLDFGIAKLVASATEPIAPAPGVVLTAPGRLVGTPRYVAPEQALLEPLDHRADIYAMGLVLYEMLVGCGPFDDAADNIELIRAHLAWAPDPPSRHLPGLPESLDAIVLRCLEKDMSRRFADARELISALRGVLGAGALPNASTSPGAPNAPTGRASAAPSADIHAVAPTARVATVSFEPPIANASSDASHSNTAAEPLTADVTHTRTGALGMTSAGQAAEPSRIPLPWVFAILAASAGLAALVTHLFYR
jgi:serine/threonine protein kinase